jgi:hypothetical protein
MALDEARDYVAVTNMSARVVDTDRQPMAANQPAHFTNAVREKRGMRWIMCSYAQRRSS